MGPLEILASHFDDAGIFYRPSRGFKLLSFVGYQGIQGHHLDIYLVIDSISIEAYDDQMENQSSLEFHVADPRWLDYVFSFLSHELQRRLDIEFKRQVDG